ADFAWVVSRVDAGNVDRLGPFDAPPFLSHRLEGLAAGDEMHLRTPPAETGTRGNGQAARPHERKTEQLRLRSACMQHTRQRYYLIADVVRRQWRSVLSGGRRAQPIASRFTVRGTRTGWVYSRRSSPAASGNSSDPRRPWQYAYSERIR